MIRLIVLTTLRLYEQMMSSEIGEVELGGGYSLIICDSDNSYSDIWTKEQKKRDTTHYTLTHSLVWNKINKTVIFSNQLQQKE